MENLDSYLWQTSMSVKNNHWYLLKFIDVSDFNRLGWNTENGTDFLECNLKLAITTKFRTWSCCILLNILLDWLQSWHYNYNLSEPTHHHFSKLVPKDFQNDSPIDYLSDFLNEKSQKSYIWCLKVLSWTQNLLSLIPISCVKCPISIFQKSWQLVILSKLPFF